MPTWIKRVIPTIISKIIKKEHERNKDLIKNGTYYDYTRKETFPIYGNHCGYIAEFYDDAEGVSGTVYKIKNHYHGISNKGRTR